MKNNTFFKLFIIIIIALLLRLWCIDKSEGLWNDEYVGWFIASENDIHRFIEKIFDNCHMPLYYLYLKLWIFLFKDTDLSLRISSVLPSLLTIPVIYSVGCKIKDNKTGLLAAFLTAINSFCIYFGQEVRLYSLLILFTGLIILYFIKAIKEKTKKSLALYFIFNALLCATHTLGIIFSFFNIAVFVYYLYKHSENYNKQNKLFLKLINYAFPFIVIVAILSPLMYSIVFSHNLSQFWSDFSLMKIVYTFIDYLSPIQTNISNSPVNISYFIGETSSLNFSFVILVFVPLFTGIFGVYKAVRQRDDILNLLLISALFYFLTLVTVSCSGKMVLSTKYSCEIYPVLITAISTGLLSLNNEILKKATIFIFIALNLVYLIFSPSSAPKMGRGEGNLAPVQLIQNSNLKEGDRLLLTYYDKDKFLRYMPDIDKFRITSINKFNFHTIMFDDDNYYETIQLGKYIHKNYFKEFPNGNLSIYLFNNYTKPMNKGERLGIIYLDNVSFLSNNSIQDIISDKKEYDRTPFIFMVFSTLRNNLREAFERDYEIEGISHAGDWTLIVYVKK